MLGKLIAGQYQIIEILGSGGFCQTYLAQDQLLPDHPICVVKRLSTTSSYQPQTLAHLRHLFNREAQALAKLGQHDQIPQLLAHFEDNQEFYLVQQFIPGYPLSAELQINRVWSESQVVSLLQEVLGILEYVHSHGLIHRDIKPNNLIRRQSDQRLVLIDFGSVKQVWTQVVTSEGRTSTKFVEGAPATVAIGTPGYMPIEQGRGRPRPNSDIYALGIIGIQALTGRRPDELMEDAETGEIVWQNYANISPLLAYVINKMVRYHAKERYQSATEVLQALQPLTAAAAGEQQWCNMADLAAQPKLLSSQSAGQLTPAKAAPHRPVASGLEKRLVLLIRLALGITSAIALILSGYYSLRTPAPPNQVKQYSTALPLSPAPVANFALASTLTGHSDSVWAIAITPDSQLLVSGSADKTIKIWHLNTGQLSRTLSGHADVVRSVALSLDGKTLASGSSDNTIKLWNLTTGKLLRTLASHSEPVWSVAFSRDGQTLASGSGDCQVKIWHPQTGELRHTLRGHSGRVFSVAISPDGQTLATGSMDKTIKLWHLPTGKLKRTLMGHTQPVRAVAISPDGNTLASGSWDKTIALWDLRTGDRRRSFPGHTARIVAVSFSADGQTLTTAGIDKNIKIWSVQTGKLLQNLTGHSDWVLAIAVSPAGQSLISSSKDKTIKIWQQ